MLVAISSKSISAATQSGSSDQATPRRVMANAAKPGREDRRRTMKPGAAVLLMWSRYSPGHGATRRRVRRPRGAPLRAVGQATTGTGEAARARRVERDGRQGLRAVATDRSRI